MNLSEYFTKEELIYSETALKYKIKNEPNEIHLKTLKHTAVYFLEPLRKLFNEKYKTYRNKSVAYVYIKITSGYRSKLLNEKVKGSTTSQHCTGEAVDFDIICKYKDGKTYKIPYTTVYNDIKTWVKEKKISVDQLICEKSGSTFWTHCSYKAAGATVNRKQFMKYINGTYINDK